MLIKIKKSECSLFYNNNFHKLPFSVNGFDILLEKFDGGDNFCGNSIGNIVDGKFVVKFYLNCDFEQDYFILDSTKIDNQNFWF